MNGDDVLGESVAEARAADGDARATSNAPRGGGNAGDLGQENDTGSARQRRLPAGTHDDLDGKRPRAHGRHGTLEAAPADLAKQLATLLLAKVHREIEVADCLVALGELFAGDGDDALRGHPLGVDLGDEGSLGDGVLEVAALGGLALGEEPVGAD